MPTSERSLTAQEQARFKVDAAIGMQMLSEVPCTRPLLIVGNVEAFIQRRQRPLKALMAPMNEFEGDNEKGARVLGTVWGNQVVRQFGWEWVCITLRGKDHYVVAAPDRALVIFAHEHVRECLESSTTECAIGRSFNMLEAGDIQPPRALSYTSMMKHVTQGAPRRAEYLTMILRKLPGMKPAHEWNEKCVDCAHV